MAKVGLSEQEINDLLIAEMMDWRLSNEEHLKNIIVKTMVANNEKVAEDVKKIVANVFQTI